MDLYIIHFIFISVCAAASYLYGERQGKKQGHSEMVEDLLLRNMVTREDLNKEYNIK